MTSPPPPRILLTGATGYIGGTILTHLLNTTPSPTPSTTPITCLVRGADRAALLTATYGARVAPALYRDLDDVETAAAVAAQHDLVVSATLGYHAASVQALLRGLAWRRAATGREVWFVHTSGTSNLADRPVSAGFVEAREFDDAEDNVYGYEEEREREWAYVQRTVELGVVDAGLALGVRTVVIMGPTVFGRGTGLFNRGSVQIPTFVRSTLERGRAVVMWEGKGVRDYVHVEDLAELYGTVVEEVLERDGRALPTGKEGIIFGGSGRFTWMEVAEGVADACYEEGKITDTRVESVGLTEGAKILASYLEGADEAMVEVGLSSNSRTVASVARKLGWRPTRGEEAWKKGFRDDVKAVLGKTE